MLMVAERSGRRARTTARMLRPVRAWTRRATANAVNTMVRCASMLSLLLDQPTPTGLAMEACRDLLTGGQRPIRLPILQRPLPGILLHQIGRASCRERAYEHEVA